MVSRMASPCARCSKTVYPWPWRTQRRQGRPRRQRRRRPDVTAVLVAQVQNLARRVGDGVVVPGCEPVGLAVVRPCVTAARFRHDEPEGGVGDDVDPGRRRWKEADCIVRRADADDILAAVRREAAGAVVEQQFRLRRQRLDFLRGCTAARQVVGQAGGRFGSFELIGQRAAVGVQYDPASGLEQGAPPPADLIRLTQEDAAALLGQCMTVAGADEILQLRVQFILIGRRLLVEKDQIRFQPFQMPVGVCSQQLPDQRQVLGIADQDEQDG